MSCRSLCGTEHSDVDHIRYVKEKRSRRLKEVTAQIEEQEVKVQELGLQLEKIRATIGEIDKEINEAGMTMANLRENIRVHRLMRELAAAQAELDAIDMEEAVKAKRIWTEKWNVEKQKETDLQTKVRRTISCHRATG